MRDLLPGGLGVFVVLCVLILELAFIAAVAWGIAMVIKAVFGPALGWS